MKLLLVLSALLIFATAAPSDEEELLNNINFEAMLANDEQRKPLFDCFLDVKPCGDLQTLKEKVIRLVQSKCAKCTPEQKEKYDHIIKIVHDKYDNELKEFIKKIQNKKE